MRGVKSMDDNSRKQLAEYLQSKLHESLNGFWFDIDDVLDHINDFFNKKELYDKREKLRKEIDEITKKIDE
jgi:hypothetical protein